MDTGRGTVILTQGVIFLAINGHLAGNRGWVRNTEVDVPLLPKAETDF